MTTAQLTKEWVEYDGVYVKSMQDIRLKNGDEVCMCWPNAGVWNTFKKDGNEKHYGTAIPNSEVTHVRKTKAWEIRVKQ